MIFLHHLSSVLAIAACWWLVHVNASRCDRWGRAIAAAYAVLAVMLTAVAFGRSWSAPIDLLLIGSKFALAVVLILIAVRHEFIERR